MKHSKQEMSLADAVKALREAMGDVSQPTFAIRHLGKSLTMVQRYEGGANISPQDLARMARLAGEANRPDLTAIFRKGLLESLGPEVVEIIRENGSDEPAKQETPGKGSGHQRKLSA